MVNIKRSRKRAFAWGTSKMTGGRRKLTASGLTLALAFTLAPATMSWADVLDDASVEAPAIEAPDAGQDAPEVDAPQIVAPLGVTPMGDGQIGVLADAEITLTLTQKTGTPDFDDDDAPGHDSSDTNNIVRTNDTVNYSLGVAIRGADQTTPTVSFELPRGQELVALPPFCIAGSSLTPESLGAPDANLTANSWESLPRQTVTCVLQDQTVGTALNYEFIAKVRSEVPHGTLMDQATFSVISDQVPTAETIEPERVTVSAAANYDLSKRVAFTSSTQGWLWQGNTTCPSPRTGEACRLITYPLTLTVPAGGKGSTPLTGDITFTENLEPASFYGAAIWAQMLAATGGDEAAAKAKYGAQLRSCSALGSGSGSRDSLPYTRAGQGNYATTANSVRNSGTATCASQPGEAATVTISNADTSAYTVPSTTGGGNAVPANLGFLVAFELSVAVPQAAILEFGDTGSNSAGETFTMQTHNEFTDFAATALDGTPVSESTENLANNVRDASMRIERGFGFNKGFTGVPGQAGNTPSGQFWAGNVSQMPGPPGSGLYKDGNTVVMPGQAVYSLLTTSVSAPAGTGVTDTLVSCDVWDDDRLALAAHPSWSGANSTNYPSNGEPVFPVFLRVDNQSKPTSYIGTEDAAIKGYKVEYSASKTAGAGTARSICGDGVWSDDPSEIATPVTDDQGRTVWEGINAVRVVWVADFPAGTTNGATNFYLAIGQVVKNAPNAEEPIGNWGASLKAAGEFDTVAEVLDASGLQGFSPTYDEETHAGTHGDRLWQGEGIARVHKYVENPQTGEFVNNAVPQYTAGDTVRYRLNPTLTGAVTVEGMKYPVTIEDCLPVGQVFVGSEQGGDALTPAEVRRGAPDGAGISCAADRQYLRWDLGDLAVGPVIDPIVVSVEILETAGNGTYTNDVAISSPADPSPLSVRSDSAQLQLVVPTGIKISKTVDPGVLEVNPAGVETPRTLTWTVQFANIDSPSDVSNVDIIDVLPANGLGGSSFAGSLRLDAVEVVAGTRITVFTTTADPTTLNVDPADTSNQPGGATVWTELTGSSSLDGVTGLRFVRDGEFVPGDDFQVDIDMTPVGNHSGDVYANVTAGQADGVSQGVGPARRTATVIASSIGDLVWNDYNRDGIQDDGEPGIEGVPVTLTGTDADGNPVSRSTETGEAGEYLFDELASGDYEVTFDISGLPGYAFTTQGAGTDHEVDSNADTSTGVASGIELGKNAQNITIDAGVIEPEGTLVIEKTLAGAGAAAYSDGDEFTFAVECTVRGETVFDDTVTLAADSDQPIESDELGPFPVGTVCVITETAAGNADAVPAPVTVTIPLNEQATAGGVATAEVTNRYSAGTISVTKTLAGDPTVVNSKANTDFEVAITCNVGDAEVFSGEVTVRGGQTVTVTDAAGDPVLLPVGATCFGEETVTGGAASVVVDHDSLQNGVTVVASDTDDAQVLEINVENTFELANGSLVINKALEGEGVEPFSGGDELTFNVVCTLYGETVFTQDVTLAVDGQTSLTSDELGPIPATAECAITETSHGSADEAAAPVTVTIPWNSTANTSDVATASLTNYYSAGTVQVTKQLAGDDLAVAAAADTVFEVLVTCQVEEPNGAGDPVRATVYSGVVKIKGGQTKQLVNDNDEPQALPLGATCFGEETFAGNATDSTVDHDTFENGTVVTAGTPTELQTLTITAVNTFTNAQLTVSKTVKGPGVAGAEYAFELVCTLPGLGEDGSITDTAYELGAADAKFTLKDGETRSITVPEGVTCQVTEVDVPRGATVAITDSDDTTEGGPSDGIVANLTGADNTVDVVNTFAPLPNTGEKSSLSLTGGQALGGLGLLAGGLLLLGGALVLWRKRRAETE